MHLENITIKLEEETKVHSPSSTTEEEGYGSGDDKELMLEVDMGSMESCGGPGGGGVGLKNGVELKRPDLKGSFRCSICAKVFCHSSSLSRHRMQAHFKSYKCTMCRKDISSSDSLRTHMFKQHQVSRMYMCRCCNWAFPDKSHLHIHLQSSSNSPMELLPHTVINRSCHAIPEPFQLIRTPLLGLPTPQDAQIASLPIPTIQSLHSPITEVTPPPETPAWLASLPRPIPTTNPIFLMDILKTPKDESEVYIFPPSPTCSFKSEFSAFHQLNLNNSDQQTMISSPIIDTSSPSSSSSSSRISPRSECFDCHMNKARVMVADNRCLFIESRMAAMHQEALEANAQMNGLEQTLLRLRMEAHVLREHNEMFQAKLLDCQNMAVNFLQTAKLDDPSEVNAFLRQLINNTILSSSTR